MEFCCGDDLCQLLHVGGLDVDNVETLILDVEVPKIDSKIVATNERLSIAVYRNAVDVVGMRVRIGLAGYGGDNRVVVSETRKLQVGGGPEVRVWIPHGPACTGNPATWSELM